MAQLDGIHRGENPRAPSSPTTVEQFVRAGEASRWTPHTLQPFSKEHDMEDDHTHHRKSVLARVREKARKWRNTLSKKKHNADGNATPSWGVSLEDLDEEEDEDPEYLGAPMYESEMAPEGYRETARQHPRAVPVISEKHILSNIAAVNANDSIRNRSLAANANNSFRTRSRSPTNQKFPIYRRSLSFQLPRTISETVAEKLAPAYATVTEATYAFASKIQSLTLPTQETKEETPTESNPTSPKAKALTPHESEQAELEKEAPGSVPSGVGTNGEQIWDKGVSVKEYLMNKLEPGEDEKALSQVISEVMSPRKTPNDVSVVVKVKEAVTSLLRSDESSKPVACHSSHNSSSHIPISTNVHEVVEEESNGRILQAN
ncbi:hypothetical protein JCGZ_02948 [Jatropha curcas]|uniref:Uncharacterized protein n=1 Tax=Jatropha curcas TaxID=180498 RepID=A0A067L4V6_JATCU|nr:low-temperature-induced 65 kDa protein [Jatropha curcas]KDP42218.1 hypothetical protein JCGZ_02948 [Jatropha curcas]